MRALFDVNVLIALHDPDHVHHVLAAQWFTAHADLGWASCAITQNGLLRIMSQPGYRNPTPLAQLVHILTQLTDLYLLGLAVKRNGRLVTFDQKIALSTVEGATTKHCMLIRS